MPPPVVTIGFIPRERFAAAAECLQRIFDCTALPFNMIVVDCGTPEPYRQQVERVVGRRDNVRIIRTDRYLLPNASKNLVLQECEGDFLCLIDNDSLVEEGWLTGLIAACEEHPADVATPLIYEHWGQRVGLHALGNVGDIQLNPVPGGAKLEFVRLDLREVERNPTRRSVQVMETHCLLFRRTVFEAIGPFDEQLNTRDFVDLSLALHRAGIRVVLEPSVRITFLEPTAIQQEERDYFLFHWDLEHARRSHRRVGEKWGLADLPMSMHFVETRRRTPTIPASEDRTGPAGQELQDAPKRAGGGLSRRQASAATTPSGGSATLTYLATRGYLAALERFFAFYPSDFAEKVVRRSYDDLFTSLADDAWWERALRQQIARPWSRPASELPPTGWCLPAGTYIFSDLERMSPAERMKAAIAWEVLASQGSSVKLLNHPTRALSRYELLRTLHERGINTFNAYRVTEARWPNRYPVFLRHLTDHSGPRTELLRSQAELEATLAMLESQGRDRDEILIVEFCETGDAEGIYRQYSVYKVGEHLTPGKLLSHYNWKDKLATARSPALAAEELRFVRDNPYAQQVRPIFELARIDYGKIDFVFLDGRIQIWEINTNPGIAAVGGDIDPDRQLAFEQIARSFEAALRALVTPPTT